jgi:hypothetical protein
VAASEVTLITNYEMGWLLLNLSTCLMAYSFGLRRGYDQGVMKTVEVINKKRSTARNKAIEEIATRDNEAADRQLSGSQLDH